MRGYTSRLVLTNASVNEQLSFQLLYSSLLTTPKCREREDVVIELNFSCPPLQVSVKKGIFLRRPLINPMSSPSTPYGRLRVRGSISQHSQTRYVARA